MFLIKYWNNLSVLLKLNRIEMFWSNPKRLFVWETRHFNVDTFRNSSALFEKLSKHIHLYSLIVSFLPNCGRNFYKTIIVSFKAVSRKYATMLISHWLKLHYNMFIYILLSFRNLNVFVPINDFLTIIVGVKMFIILQEECYVNILNFD